MYEVTGLACIARRTLRLQPRLADAWTAASGRRVRNLLSLSRLSLRRGEKIILFPVSNLALLMFCLADPWTAVNRIRTLPKGYDPEPRICLPLSRRARKQLSRGNKYQQGFESSLCWSVDRQGFEPHLADAWTAATRTGYEPAQREQVQWSQAPSQGTNSMIPRTFT